MSTPAGRTRCSRWAGRGAVRGFGVLNVLRGRRFLSIPSPSGDPRTVAFVILPALLPVVFSGQLLFGLVTVLVNAAILFLAYLVVGFGLVAIVRWAGVRFFAQMARSVTVLVRAVPLLLFFSLVIFLTTEIWQVFTATGPRCSGWPSACSCCWARCSSAFGFRVWFARSRRTPTSATRRSVAGSA